MKNSEDRGFPPPVGCSGLLIDATRKGPYPPVGLPKQSFMERALKIWQEEKMPELKLKTPWFGYPLGHWDAEDDAIDADKGLPEGLSIEKVARHSLALRRRPRRVAHQHAKRRAAIREFARDLGAEVAGGASQKNHGIRRDVPAEPLGPRRLVKGPGACHSEEPKAVLKRSEGRISQVVNPLAERDSSLRSE